MIQFRKVVGLHTRQDTIAVAVSDACGDKPRYYRDIPNKPEAIAKVVKALTAEGEALSCCYESGPCGFEIYRHLTGLGQPCAVVAHSLILPRAGDRVQTDRRDYASLSRLHRAGKPTPIWGPTQEQETMRDLTPAREDMKGLERTTKQRLNAVLLR